MGRFGQLHHGRPHHAAKRTLDWVRGRWLLGHFGACPRLEHGVPPWSRILDELIAFPLLLIYRQFYGTRLMLRMLVMFWAVMAAAGLITEGIFRVTGLVPKTRPTQIVPDHFSWNYTSYLNAIFLALFAVLFWAYRNRVRLGGDAGYALDPVCGMQVQIANTPATVMYEGKRFYFCSDRCAGRFSADPDRHSHHQLDAGHEEHKPAVH